MNSYKRILVVILLAVVSITTVSGQDIIKRIVKNGELRLGTTTTQPPYSLKTKDDVIVGYEIDIAKLLASSMNVELKIVELPFNGLLDALEKGKVDIVMSGMTINTERNMNVAFVGPYMVSGKSILTKTVSLGKLKDKDQINNSEISLVTLKGSTSEKFVKTSLPKAQLTTTENYEEAIKLVMDDKVTGMIADIEIIQVTMMRYQNSDLAILEEALTIEPIGMALPANDHLFLNLVENYVSRLKLTGALEQTQKYWFKNGNWLLQMK